MANENIQNFNPETSIRNAAELVNNYQHGGFETTMKKKKGSLDDSSALISETIADLHKRIESVKLLRNQLYSGLISGYTGYYYLKKLNDECREMKASAEMYENLSKTNFTSLYDKLSNAAVQLPNADCEKEIRDIGAQCKNYFNTLKNDLGYDELNFAFKVEEYTGTVPSDIITNPELDDATKTFDSIPVGTPFRIDNDTVKKDYVISELGFKLPGTYTVTSKDYSVLSGKLDFTKKVTEDYPESITLNLEASDSFVFQDGSADFPYRITNASQLSKIMAIKPVNDDDDENKRKEFIGKFFYSLYYNR